MLKGTYAVVALRLLGLLLSTTAFAETVSIDLSNVAGGDYTVIDAPGGSIAQVFSGQTAVDTGVAPPITPPSTVTGIVGTPMSPLGLANAGILRVTKSPSLLSECGISTPEWFQSAGIDGSPSSGPISVLLEQNASAISWNMGSGHGGSVTIDFFDADGLLIHTEMVNSLPTCYGPYTFSGFGNFKALTIYENSDRYGMAFWNFEYQSLPRVACSGFEPPMENYPVKAKQNRAFPLRIGLMDDFGMELTDAEVAAPPVVQVIYMPIGGEAVDVSDDALPVGIGSEGNQFEFAGDDGFWQFNLKARNYTAEGEYVVSVASGDESEYTVEPTCVTGFLVE